MSTPTHPGTCKTQRWLFAALVCVFALFAAACTGSDGANGTSSSKEIVVVSEAEVDGESLGTRSLSEPESENDSAVDGDVEADLAVDETGDGAESVAAGSTETTAPAQTTTDPPSTSAPASSPTTAAAPATTTASTTTTTATSTTSTTAASSTTTSSSSTTTSSTTTTSTTDAPTATTSTTTSTTAAPTTTTASTTTTSTAAPTTTTSTTAAPTTTTTTSTTLPTPNGLTIYAQNCAACHSSDGSGGLGPNIQSVVDPSHVVDTVIAGPGSMPSFSSTLSSDEINAVAAYVVTGL